MLKSRLLHPEIQEVLGRAGHSSKILIADGNYPFATQLGPNARLVSLNLSPGLVNATQVLEAIVSAVPIEEATVMEPVTSGAVRSQKRAFDLVGFPADSQGERVERDPKETRAIRVL
jgi:D-ribose pyranose/furanose isomerase RbsD